MQWPIEPARRRPHNTGVAKMFFLTQLLVFSISAMGQSPAPSDRDFEVKRDYLRQRYADFYIRQNEKDRQTSQREFGAQEVRDERKRLAKTYEADRKNFVKNRKTKVEKSEEPHEKELKEQQAARQKALVEYRKKQQRLQGIEKQVGTIPDWMEYELYDTYEASDTP